MYHQYLAAVYVGDIHVEGSFEASCCSFPKLTKSTHANDHIYAIDLRLRFDIADHIG